VLTGFADVSGSTRIAGDDHLPVENNGFAHAQFEEIPNLSRGRTERCRGT
jgi:hypothetical protein